MAYAIQIPFDGDWLYITRVVQPHDVEVQTYETREKAEAAAKIWGENAIVVEIKEQNIE